MTGQLEQLSKQTKNYLTKGEAYYKKTRKYLNIPKHKKLIYRSLLGLAVLLLLATSAYAGKHASDTYSTDSNALILTQQFSKGATFPAILPGPHATLIIIPLVYIQGHLPYHYTSFTLVNMGLVLITMLAWAFLLIKLFGRRYEIPILVLLSSLIFTSIALSLSIGYTTIRNIEYPIVLWFVMIIGELIRQKTKYTRKQFALAAIGSTLFSIVYAGDSFFGYAILVPLLAVMVWYWVQSREFTRGMLKALGLIVATVIGAHILKFILSKAGIITFDYSFWGPNVILGTAKIWASFGVALQQVLDLHGASIFGQVVNYHNLAVFVNFGLLLASVTGILFILRDTNRNYIQKKGLTDAKATDNGFVFAVMAISYFVVFLIYALSGYAIATLPNGHIISDNNARYLSLMPFISTIGFIWLLKKHYNKHVGFTAVLCLVLVLGIFTSHHSIGNTYADRSQQLEVAPPRSSVDSLVDILKTNDVKVVSADYWYGPVLQFWANKSIGLVTQSGCSPSLKTTGSSAFVHKKGVNAALVINRGALNYAFWNCTDEQLQEFYGTPTKKLQVPGPTSSTLINIWIYKN